MQFRNKTTALVAALVAFSLTAAACGGDDDDTSGGGASATEASTSSSGSSDDTSASATSPGDTSNGLGSTAAGNPDANHVPQDSEGPPAHGGTLQFGIDSDTAGAWAPFTASCAGACGVVLAAISDGLFAITPEGETVPLLVESADHNADYTEWVLHIRDGITFHDGTPLDGEAVKFNLDACINSPTTGSAFVAVDTVTASGQDVTITTKDGPWVSLPTYISYNACGLMFSQEWLSSLADVPQRNPEAPVYDAALAATPADGDPAKPVGLGAFAYESYTPGNGNTFKAVRNEDYWRGANGITDEDLPYLDAIEATVFVDYDSRQSALRSGQIDALNTANADAMKVALDDDDLKTTTTNLFGEAAFIMLNVASGDADPNGDNADSPLLERSCRQALAAAIDRDRMSAERGGDLEIPANGPFGPGEIGYLEDTGYPDFDIDQANAYLDECLAAVGTESIDIRFDSISDPFNVETNQLLVSMWQEAFGDKVKATITPIEQGQFIGQALNGTFQAFYARLHSGSDPDQQRVWWSSATALPIGTTANNFGRIQDPVIDEQLEIIKSDGDQAARTAAAEAISREFGEQVWNLWLTHALSAVITQPYVNGISANQLPDGTQGVGLHGQQRQQLNQVWCDDGACE